jgi:hypothetical protein
LDSFLTIWNSPEVFDLSEDAGQFIPFALDKDLDDVVFSYMELEPSLEDALVNESEPVAAAPIDMKEQWLLDSVTCDFKAPFHNTIHLRVLRSSHFKRHIVSHIASENDSRFPLRCRTVGTCGWFTRGLIKPQEGFPASCGKFA